MQWVVAMLLADKLFYVDKELGRCNWCVASERTHNQINLTQVDGEVHYTTT